MILPIILDREPRAYKYIQNTKDRNETFILPIFHIDIRTMPLKKNRLLAVFDIKVRVPKFYFLGGVVLLLALVLNKVNLLFWAMGISLTFFFFTPSFYYLTILLGLSKIGYKGKVRRLPGVDAVRVMLENGTN